jgi:predicted nucleic acid-binding Zn ribbon protein
MDYEKERDLNVMIILILLSVTLVLWFGSTIEAFKPFAPAFFVVMLIAVWLVSMNVGRFGKKWKEK